jgi:hypothetical protein
MTSGGLTNEWSGGGERRARGLVDALAPRAPRTLGIGDGVTTSQRTPIDESSLCSP